MESRKYSELSWTRDSSISAIHLHQKEGERAVKIAHKDELEKIKSALKRQQSVLVICDKELAPYIHKSIEPDFPNTQSFFRHVAHQAPANAQSSDADAVSMLARRLSTLLRDSKEGVVVIGHLDLMCCWVNGSPRPEVNDIVYWMNSFPGVTRLAFWDPNFPVPRVIESLFPHRVSLQLFNREDLYRLVATEEAQKISVSSDEFTLSAQLALYQYLSGVNVVEVRRLLRSLVDRKYPACENMEEAQKALNLLRDQRNLSETQPELGWGHVYGYDDVRQELKQKVLFPFRLRNKAGDPETLRQSDLLIPRGLIFWGPPGTGKTEWAKWLASQLGATLIVIHGPELKSKYHGETEAAIRQLFARARRLAPSLILIDEMDSLMSSRSQASQQHETSIVAQLLTEMDGLHKDEAVLVVGTTNRLDDIDSAFRRPGRFGETIEIGYPVKDSDREAIFVHYDEAFKLGLGEHIKYLVAETGEPLDDQEETDKKQYHDAYVNKQIGWSFYKQAGPAFHRRLARQFGLSQPARFSGDHLRAICLHLLRHLLYLRQQENQPDAAITRELIDEAIKSVRQRGADRDNTNRQPYGLGDDSSNKNYSGGNFGRF